MLGRFAAKMFKAKKMEYDAVKEIMPECMKKSVSKFENEAAEFCRQFCSEFISSGVINSDNDCEKKSTVKKVTVE